MEWTSIDLATTQNRVLYGNTTQKCTGIITTDLGSWGTDWLGDNSALIRSGDTCSYIPA